ncbi:MAG: hypothetical protein JJT99_10530 [Rhodobacteraceae bacterium]|nr:hypothetical protein [Paracoccaceae bacterium]
MRELSAILRGITPPDAAPATGIGRDKAHYTPDMAVGQLGTRDAVAAWDSCA